MYFIIQAIELLDFFTISANVMFSYFSKNHMKRYHDEESDALEINEHTTADMIASFGIMHFVKQLQLPKNVTVVKPKPQTAINKDTLEAIVGKNSPEEKESKTTTKKL